MDDEIAELLGAGIEETPPVPQASRELRVTAFDRAQQISSLTGRKPREQHMVQAMGYEIDKVQQAQFRRSQQDDRIQSVQGGLQGQMIYYTQPLVDPNMPLFDPSKFIGQKITINMSNVNPNVWKMLGIDPPAPPPLPATPHLTDDQREAFIAVAEGIAEVFGGLAQAFQAVTSVISAFADDAITAMRPLLDLLDQREAIPSQPLCPSHACAMRGGRCPRCDRRRR